MVIEIVEDAIPANEVQMMERPKICFLCGVPEDTFHNNSSQHLFNVLLFSWKECRKSIVKNRHGIEVNVQLQHVNGLKYWSEEKTGSHITKASVAQSLHYTDGIDYLFSVNNISSNTIFLLSVVILHPYTYFSFLDEGGILINGNIAGIEPGCSYSFKVKFKPDTLVVGSFEIPIAMQFQTTTKDTFSIIREVVVLITDNDETNVNAEGKSPFTNVTWVDIQSWVPPTIRVYSPIQYEIPRAARRVFKMGLNEFKNITQREIQILKKYKSKLTAQHPTIQNYQDFFHVLLWLDERGSELMLQRYNMENVTMGAVCQGKFLELEVPGLAEKRPSLIVGDLVSIRLHEDHTVYDGLVKTVSDSTILIEGVNKELREIIYEYPDMELDVSFHLNRLTYERMHSSIDRCITKKMLPCLFPNEDLLKKTPRKTSYHISNNDLFDRNIVNNTEQKIAVESILNSKSGKAPYIVFGPPGTGKTVTIVEAILQIKHRINSARILVCAPANAACDMLTLKLIPRCKKEELIRVNSESRDWNSIPQEVKQYSNCRGDKFQKVTAADLMDYRIVVCTLVNSGRYSKSSQYSPDFIFIDEAAQATEPEVIIPVSLLKLGKQLVLAGDPKQLGPTCASVVAENYSLGVSLLERLMKTPLYQSNNPDYITMLKLNYRAHPAILHIPNELFYSGQLIPKSNSALKDPLANIYIYPRTLKGTNSALKRSENGDAAVEFCSVIAKERREGRSPSYFNTNEIEMVVKYIIALKSLPDVPVKLEDIGVVTPYVRQVHRIKDALRGIGFGDIEVGTPEVFQGREKRILIISSVRAQHSLLLHDRRYKLGFIKNEKRFNVAITRAKSKLIIIGCPLVLRFDENWSHLMNYCLERSAYFGGKLDRRTEEQKLDITKRLNHVFTKDSQYDHNSTNQEKEKKKK